MRLMRTETGFSVTFVAPEPKCAKMRQMANKPTGDDLSNRSFVGSKFRLSWPVWIQPDCLFMNLNEFNRGERTTEERIAIVRKWDAVAREG